MLPMASVLFLLNLVQCLSCARGSGIVVGNLQRVFHRVAMVASLAIIAYASILITVEQDQSSGWVGEVHWNEGKECLHARSSRNQNFGVNMKNRCKEDGDNFCELNVQSSGAVEHVSCFDSFPFNSSDAFNANMGRISVSLHIVFDALFYATSIMLLSFLLFVIYRSHKITSIEINDEQIGLGQSLSSCAFCCPCQTNYCPFAFCTNCCCCSCFFSVRMFYKWVRISADAAFIWFGASLGFTTLFPIFSLILCAILDRAWPILLLLSWVLVLLPYMLFLMLIFNSYLIDVLIVLPIKPQSQSSKSRKKKIKKSSHKHRIKNEIGPVSHNLDGPSGIVSKSSTITSMSRPSTDPSSAISASGGFQRFMVAVFTIGVTCFIFVLLSLIALLFFTPSFWQDSYSSTTGYGIVLFGVLHIFSLLVMTAIFWISCTAAPLSSPRLSVNSLNSSGTPFFNSHPAIASKSKKSTSIISSLILPHPSTLPPPPLPSSSLASCDTFSSFSSFFAPTSHHGLPPLPISQVSNSKMTERDPLLPPLLVAIDSNSTIQNSNPTEHGVTFLPSFLNEPPQARVMLPHLREGSSRAEFGFLAAYGPHPHFAKILATIYEDDEEESEDEGNESFEVAQIEENKV